MAKILIADDNVQITSILREYAEKEGHLVSSAYSGTEALANFYTFSAGFSPSGCYDARYGWI